MRDRKKWFHKFDGPYYALWWVPSGQVPSVEEGKQRLDIRGLYYGILIAFSLWGVIAIRLGRKLKWDAARQEIVDDPEASKLLSREMRSPWHL